MNKQQVHFRYISAPPLSNSATCDVTSKKQKRIPVRGVIKTLGQATSFPYANNGYGRLFQQNLSCLRADGARDTHFLFVCVFHFANAIVNT